MDFKSLSDPIVLVGDEDQKPKFFNKPRPPKTNFSKILAGGLTVFLLFAVGLGVYLSQQPTELEPQASEPTTQYQNKIITATDSGEIRNP